MTEYEFVIVELPSDLIVSSGSASTLEAVEKEAGHYAAQYAQDSDIKVNLYQVHRVLLSSNYYGMVKCLPYFAS